MQFDILIIGAGATGLMAMKELAIAGYQVGLLEATGKTGGRIATLTAKGFDMPVEAGAEFIHGRARITLDLLKEAGIGYTQTRGKMMMLQNGVWLGEEPQDEHPDMLAEKLEQLNKDCTISEFLDIYFPAGEYDTLRRSVKQFAEGFELADITKASALIFKEEWKQIDEEQYRINGGYGQLINYLFEQCRLHDGTILFNSPVTKIEHCSGYAIAHTADNQEYKAGKLIVTVSTGVLQPGDIAFIPSIPSHEAAIQQLAFGQVIKFLYQFKHPFWKERSKDVAFFLSDEAIPAWWTQLPEESCLLTGWLGGPDAGKAASLSKNELHQTAIHSLCNIFHLDKNYLQNDLLHHEIISWQNEPYIKAGYSYNTLRSEELKQTLLTPVNDTIYFAGEAFYTGESQGTVEAALGSGKEVAERIIRKVLQK